MISTARSSEAAQPDDATPVQQLTVAVDRMGVTRAHRLIYVLIGTSVFFSIVQQNAIGLVGPVLTQQWSIGATQIGLLNSVTFFSMTVGAMLSGMAADRLGRKRLLSINVVVYTAGSLLCAFAPDLASLFITRAIIGIGLGGSTAIAITTVAEFSPTRHRASAVSALNVAGGGVGNFLAPFYGLVVFGALAPLFSMGESSWRWLFGLLSVPIVLAFLIQRYLPEPPRFLLARGRIEECNRSLSILASGRLVPATRHIDPTRFIRGGSGRGLSGIRMPGVFSRRFRTRSSAISLTFFMASAAHMCVLTLMPTILVAQGHSIVAGVGYTAVMQAGSLAGSLVATVWGSRLKRRSVVALSAICAALSAVAFGLFATTTAAILILGALFQFFILVLNTTLWSWLPELFPTRIRGFGTGTVKSIGGMGAVVMAPVAGLIFDNWGLGAMFMAVACLCLLALAASRFGPETSGKSLEELHEYLDAAIHDQ